jgi:hypothetical protein
MSSLFLALFFVAIIVLIVGLISPKLVMRWGAEEKRTRGRAALIYGIAIVVLFVAFGITSNHEPHQSAASPSQTTTTNPSPEASKSATVPTPAAAPAAATPTTSAPAPVAQETPQPSWHEVITFQGSSIKNTQTFHIQSDNWRINWSTWPGDYGNMNFAIMVYNSDGSPAGIGVAANVIGQGSDISYMRGSGDYYLAIDTAQPYKIVIEEQH